MKLIIIDYGNFNLKYKSDTLGVISSKHTMFEPNEEGFNRFQYKGKGFL